ncbi:TPA: DUF551 domain-containing protein [Klebsiella pneumoniae]|uniref:DUF551 domain-containing protein n=1 Tax=Klebsiella pneumoniae TaxID=573 RepID=UPI000DE91596|nr:DUF551 domain-containing protein [Klebsiella pneumoniae]RBQ56226.1 hypothetical protein C2128_01360 [Klebsiella pneumoniae]HBT4608892.1 DUF551 domain-containing protein [Klebsiella pneumoniae]HBT4688309.1 DUF551 domain-containing protein [Klebsiella pneumoniae]HBZ7300664.1 DUF551 domain-containing protein [Klebsiella pneumoniae]HBZ7306316.1 DUF551 domain-containing protein [Klebsiella pneumoniae]
MISKLTRERLQEIAEDGFLKHGESKELARMALAAMDSEPVAEVVSIYGDPEAFGEREIRPLVGIQQMPYGTKLYRHAQQPVVPAELRNRIKADGLAELLNDANDYAPLTAAQWETLAKNWHQTFVGLSGEDDACRSAMLQELQKSAGTEAICRSNENVQAVEVQSVTGINPASALVSLQKKAESIIGSHPVIPDGYVLVPKEPTEEMNKAGWAAMNEYDAINPTYRAMLAAAPQPPGSDPATVPGRWIQLSQQMPEDEQEVLTINKMGHRFVSFFDKHSGLFFDRLDAPAACCIEHVLVTHWMPLPAAPQEGK